MDTVRHQLKQPVREFQTVEESVRVLGQYTTRKRLEALRDIGVNLDDHTHEQLAERVCATREKVCSAMHALGIFRR